LGRGARRATGVLPISTSTELSITLNTSTRSIDLSAMTAMGTSASDYVAYCASLMLFVWSQEVVKRFCCLMFSALLPLSARLSMSLDMEPYIRPSELMDHKWWLVVEMKP
jgi:hypothetical protein